MPKSLPVKTDKKPSPQKSPKRPKKVQPIVDESLWRPSRIHVDQTISKTKAVAEYRLSAADLEGLSSTMSEAIVKVRGEDRVVPMILYNERQVEHLAWRIRGGPDAFETYLNKLRATHAKTHPNKEFKESASYSRVNITGGVSLMQAAPSRTLVDPLKQQFVDLGRLWLWEAANMVFAATANEFGVEHYFPSEKEAALRLPSLLGPNAYPTRPGTLPPATQSYTKLRSVLAQAPSTRDELDSYEDHVEETTYFWKEEYMAELFNALIAVIHEHGIEGVGWKSARWEVYDTHTRCIQPLSFWHSEREWCDEVQDWLSGRRMQCFDAGTLLPRQDNKSELGKRYNEMLPLLQPGQ
ncbi:hypothetical protein B0H13DRAFT_1732197 [Mycena leptocephala]|nr:hypothetical protein B0H13DRAFT_1732197 [Mycena leptocephala]